MTHQLSFTHLIEYDAGQPGITIPITLNAGENQVTFEAKIDTGATRCIFGRRYGEELGLTIENRNKIRIGTATGSFEGYLHEISLIISGYVFIVDVCFAANEFFDRNVLGRHGFLDRVRIAFVDYEGKLYLSELNEEVLS